MAGALSVTVGPVLPADEERVKQLLQQCGLQDTGVLEPNGQMVVARVAGKIVGMARLEVYREGGWLRSVAVDPAWQRQGIGRRLVAAILALARGSGLQQIFLLTETAAGFFERMGFVPVTRAEVPPSVWGAPQFAWPACASCQVMRWTNPAAPALARSQPT